MLPQPQPNGDPNFNIDEWEPEEPLWMTNVPDNIDNPALQAIQSLVYDDQTPEEIAENFKEQGNSCFTKGKKYYADAIKYYTQAIEQPVADSKKRSVYFSNRSAVNLQCENYGKVLADCDEAIRLDSNNIKAFFRASKAAYALAKYQQAVDYCVVGLKVEPNNKILEREQSRAEKQIQLLKETEEKKQITITLEAKKKHELQTAIESRGIVMGPRLFDVQNKDTSKVYLDEEGQLHWPVMFVYEEYAQVDFIEDFMEENTLGDHLAVMFPENEYPDWDVHKKYAITDIEIYAILNQVTPLDPKKQTGKRARKIRINHTTQLKKVLQHEEFVVPGTPLFYVISAKSTFKGKFIKMSIDSLMKLQ